MVHRMRPDSFLILYTLEKEEKVDLWFNNSLSETMYLYFMVLCVCDGYNLVKHLFYPGINFRY